MTGRSYVYYLYLLERMLEHFECFIASCVTISSEAVFDVEERLVVE